MKVVVALTGFNLKSVENPPARPNGDGPVAGIKWVLQNPAIGTTVPNMRTIPQLEMNFRAMSEPYTPEDEKLLVYAKRADPAGLLPHVLPVQRSVSERHARDGRAAFPVLS